MSMWFIMEWNPVQSWSLTTVWYVLQVLAKNRCIFSWLMYPVCVCVFTVQCVCLSWGFPELGEVWTCLSSRHHMQTPLTSQPLLAWAHTATLTVFQHRLPKDKSSFKEMACSLSEQHRVHANGRKKILAKFRTPYSNLANYAVRFCKYRNQNH